MKNYKVLFLILSVLLVFVVLFFSLEPAPQSKKINWKEHYKTNKDPFGTGVLYNLIDNKASTLTDIQRSIPSIKSSGNTYIAIGHGLQFSENKIDDLFEFVDQGNTAFISANYLPFKLMNRLYSYNCNYTGWNGEETFVGNDIKIFFLHHDITHKVDSFSYVSGNKVYDSLLYRWHYIPEHERCNESSSLIYLAQAQNGYPIFIKMNYGIGHFYVLTTPALLTNKFLKEEAGLQFANNVFTHIPLQKVYWEKGALTTASNNFKQPPSNPFLSSDSPLQYILTQPALAWAWYLLLIGSLLYMFFKSKRRQRIIPTTIKNENTSLAFVENIGQLYFDNHRHKAIVLEMMKAFLLYIQKHHNFIIKDSADKTQIEQLSKRINVPTDDLNAVFNIYQNIKSSNYVSSNMLIQLHQKIQKIYNLL